MMVCSKSPMILQSYVSIKKVMNDWIPDIFDTLFQCSDNERLLDQEDRAAEERLARELQAAVAWLSHLNFASKQNDTFNRRQEGTGSWFLEEEVVKLWLDGVKQTLWCPGIRMFT